MSAEVACTSARTAVDHYFLRHLLDWLDRQVEAPGLVALLDDLRDYLSVHFSAEEADGGLFDVLTESGTEVAARVDRLRRDHVAILARIDVLRAAIDPIANDASSDTRHGVRHLGRLLREHEAEEQRLIQDVLRDEGRKGVER
jgi:hemerythrin HHE cation binding domain-containing protein